MNAYEHGARDPGAEALVRPLAGAGATITVRTAPRIDLERNARILEQVLDLAERLPTRRRGRGALDATTVLGWALHLVGIDDPRVRRLRELLR